MSLSGHSSNLRLAIVLLAAGEGSRLGSIPKALLRKDGKSLLEAFCISADVLNPVEFIVVTGFHSQAIELELDRLSKVINTRITVIHNPKADRGQASSVRLALESLQSQFDVLAVCLSDQPNLGAKEIQRLLEQFASRQNTEEIVMPQVNGQRGNPVLFSRKLVAEILTMPGMACRPYMDQHPDLVNIYETENTAYILDVDTSADLQQLEVTRQ
jgi:CTP:molybdopterin cytidylyltransferase MocA